MSKLYAYSVLGVKVKVKIKYDESCFGSNYDPNTKAITMPVGVHVNIKNTFGPRDEDWTLTHEVAHFVLDKHAKVIKKDLETVFGSFDDDEYDGSVVSEFFASFGYNDRHYVSARATLCPEEDFAETVAFLTSRKGRIPKECPAVLRKKFKAVLRAFDKIKNQ